MSAPSAPPVARRRGNVGARTALAVFLVSLNLIPVYWLMVTALKPAGRILTTDPWLVFPFEVTLDNFTFVLANPLFLRFMVNSLIVAGSTTLVSIVISALAGYSLARLRFPMSRYLGTVVLFTYMVPSVLLVVPLFQVMASLNLHNTYQGLIITHISFAIPFCVWLLRGFFRSLPEELEHAAMVDGATRLGVLWRIVLPLAAPGIGAAAMFAFILSWNEYLFALVFMTTNAMRTAPVGIASTFMTQANTGLEWARLMAASLVASAPVGIFFVFLQRSLVQGLSVGAIKG